MERFELARQRFENLLHPFFGCPQLKIVHGPAFIPSQSNQVGSLEKTRWFLFWQKIRAKFGVLPNFKNRRHVQKFKNPNRQMVFARQGESGRIHHRELFV